MKLDVSGNIVITHQKLLDCEFCKKAKTLLHEHAIPFTVIISDKIFFGDLFKVTHNQNLPQIFLNGEFIGNFSELQKHLLEKIK